MIDFAKTVSLPIGSSITHINEWIVGNHEDGYLIGINNLIQLFEELLADNMTLELQQQQNDEKEAHDTVYNDDADDAQSTTVTTTTSNRIDCTSEKETMTCENSNIHIPIDAMKIDHQQSNSDSVEEK